MKNMAAGNNSSWVARVLGWVTGIATAVVFVGLSVLLLGRPAELKLATTKNLLQAESLNAKLEEIDKRLALIDSQRVAINGALKKLENLPPETKDRALIAGFDERLNSIQGRFKQVEDVIIQDPQKSLSLVIMKRDFESMQKSIDEKYLLQNSAIDRLYNIFGWSIGALLIAIAAQIISGYVISKQKA
jgi:hypothetical protein